MFHGPDSDWKSWCADSVQRGKEQCGWSCEMESGEFEMNQGEVRSESWIIREWQ